MSLFAEQQPIMQNLAEAERSPSPSLSEAPKEECGIFGVYAPGEEVARIAFFGLFALQHRGQESAGIAVSRAAGDAPLAVHRRMGLVSQAFTEDDLARLRGDLAIGHTR